MLSGFFDHLGYFQAGELAVNLAEPEAPFEESGQRCCGVGFGNPTVGMVMTALGFTPEKTTNPRG